MDAQRYFNEIDKGYASLDAAPLEARLQALLAQSRAEHGDASALTASLYSELGAFYRGQGRYEESEQSFLHTLEVLKTAGKADSADYATAINNLAGTRCLLGRYDEAEEGFRQALLLYEKTVGETHILYASALNNLSLVCLDRGDLQGSSDLLTQASEILALLPEHRDELVSSLSNLGVLYQRQDRYAESMAVLKYAVNLLETELGTATPHYHAALNSLGVTCFQAGRYEEACRWFRSAAEAAEKLYGRAHRDCQAALKHLALAENAMEWQT